VWLGVVAVDLRRVHDDAPPATWLAGMNSQASLLATLRPVIAALMEAAHITATPADRVIAGRLASRVSPWGTPRSGEIGVYIWRGWLAGAVAHCTWNEFSPAVCSVRVGPLSRSQAIAQWASLAVGLVLGFVITAFWLGDFIASPVLRLSVALLLGVALGLTATVVLIRGGIMVDRETSRGIADALSSEVSARLAGWKLASPLAAPP